MVWTIFFLIVCLLCSLFIWYIIYRYITEKPLVLINIVDLLYRDSISYIYLLCLVLSVALAHTILMDNKNFKLNFDFAIFYATLINFFCNNIYVGLTISGGLRLISLVKNSEAAGLQLLGPDKEALFVIRVLSNIVSLLFPCFNVTVLGAYPGLFGLFNGEENISNLDDIKRNNFASLYLVLPFITIFINLSVQVYSKRMRKKLNEASQIFVISHLDDVSVSEDKFSFSISHVVVFPVLILTAFLQSFADRKQRLFFLSPFHSFLINVAFPVLIINNSPKIKSFFHKEYVVPFKETLKIIKTFFTKCLANKIGPIESYFGD